MATLRLIPPAGISFPGSRKHVTNIWRISKKRCPCSMLGITLTASLERYDSLGQLPKSLKAQYLDLSLRHGRKTVRRAAATENAIVARLYVYFLIYWSHKALYASDRPAASASSRVDRFRHASKAPRKTSRS